MDPEPGNVTRYRFAGFELDAADGTLRNAEGAPVRLQHQPLRLLALLVARHGELVEREDIRKHLWSDETFVDFEHSVNFCIRQIRAALGEEAKSPRYIETIPRRGYRFIARVEIAADETRPDETAAAVSDVRPEFSKVRVRRRSAVFAAIGIACIAILIAGWYRVSSRGLSAVAVAEGNAVDAGFGTKNEPAREAYIKGRYFWRKGTNADIERALPYLEDAVKLDPRFAAAYAAIADVYQLLGNQGARPAREVFPKARAAAELALNISPNLPEARMVLGTVLFRFDWDWAAAEAELKAAVTLNPQSAAARHDYAWFLISMNRFQEGVAEIRKAHDLDPISLRANVDIGWALLRAGQVDEAITHLRRIVELEPQFLGARHCLEAAYTDKNSYREALEFAQPGGGLNLTEAAARQAMQARWRQQLADLEQSAQRPAAVPQNYLAASYHALLGETDAAIVSLNRAFADRDPSLVAVHVDGTFKSIRNDGRFNDLVQRIGLPQR